MRVLCAHPLWMPCPLVQQTLNRHHPQLHCSQIHGLQHGHAGAITHAGSTWGAQLQNGLACPQAEPSTVDGV
jgi:hypothetical protein